MEGGPNDPPPSEWAVRDWVDERYERIKAKEGLDKADAFYRVASGKETPLLHFLPAWLAEGGVKGPYQPRVKRQLQSDIEALGRWMEAQKLTPTIEAVDRKVAGAFVTALARAQSGKTVGRKVSACRSYWVYLGRKGHVPDDRNPWDRQAPAIPKHSGHEGAKERSFTEAEMKALLSGEADTELADLMRVAALSGMRIEEIYRLTVADCAGGVFNIRRSKTKAGVRKVPIHPDLMGIVVGRVTGKDDGSFLFHEAGTVEAATKGPAGPARGRRGSGKGRVVSAGAERSMAASKRFGRFREAVGVEEKVLDKRRSLVNFHSFRRWFVTEALRAGQPERVVKQVVGHAPQGVTFTSYFGGDVAGTLRACVEAVRLPAQEEDTAGLSTQGRRSPRGPQVG